MDKIYLQGCRFYGYHGAFAEEQKLGQIFVVDCTLSLDLGRASQTDRLEDTVHYGMVFDCIKKHVEEEKYRLLEKLGGVIIADILQQFAAVQAVKLTINKENPPINGHYTAVGIELERSRP
ncbi:dihydroneopterin aldolase [Streptococcus chenjunshii]|uniref:7,8-dihydroneopterin aldolase n=1 Tax=Streptococcus chenjunshii TaxID=2173853 RepID=A0A372KN04_9STRE|nr:dihydroneopterin aldolase [Streptococcus chenjunshii]AXQ78779.1 dihydroneopterin aldolase [Streptococcus chenjunshii]RFU51540.1 dihydroneopterin aldolase [Streptococcus chenjunshii]RFU53659.1 dihydroneopterin aldolase [Streptococcus chenjunshii]